MRTAIVAMRPGVDTLDEDEPRIECKTADEAAGVVANLILQGYAYIHIDSLTVLEMHRAKQEALQKPL